MTSKRYLTEEEEAILLLILSKEEIQSKRWKHLFTILPIYKEEYVDADNCFTTIYLEQLHQVISHKLEEEKLNVSPLFESMANFLRHLPEQRLNFWTAPSHFRNIPFPPDAEFIKHIKLVIQLITFVDAQLTRNWSTDVGEQLGGYAGERNVAAHINSEQHHLVSYSRILYDLTFAHERKAFDESVINGLKEIKIGLLPSEKQEFESFKIFFTKDNTEDEFNRNVLLAECILTFLLTYLKEYANEFDYQYVREILDPIIHVVFRDEMQHIPQHSHLQLLPFLKNEVLLEKDNLNEYKSDKIYKQLEEIFMILNTKENQEAFFALLSMLKTPLVEKLLGDPTLKTLLSGHCAYWWTRDLSKIPNFLREINSNVENCNLVTGAPREPTNQKFYYTL